MYRDSFSFIPPLVSGWVVNCTEQSTLLLKKYWKIPSKQIKNSVVLERF